VRCVLSLLRAAAAVATLRTQAGLVVQLGRRHGEATSILDGYEAAVAALGASGRTISASAVPAKTQTLVDSMEKRSALAGALLLHVDGSYHTVPHFGLAKDFDFFRANFDAHILSQSSKFWTNFDTLSEAPLTANLAKISFHAPPPAALVCFDLNEG
jgi:hypothetical protein